MVPESQGNRSLDLWPGNVLVRLDLVLLNPFPVQAIEVYNRPWSHGGEVEDNRQKDGEQRRTEKALVSDPQVPQGL